MFCPQCNAEYRPGFTRCADCDVELVNDLPEYALAGQAPPADPGDPNEDPFCSFWKGEDARVHAELCEVLEEAGIPHKTVFRRDHLFNLSNYAAYQVGVPFSLFEKAEKAVQAAFGTEGAEERETLNTPRLLASPQETVRKLPATMSPAPDEDIPGPPSAGVETDWYPEDARVSVWSTDANEPSDFLVAALHENGINCRLDEQGSHTKLYVLPQDASRAREILREVVEGEPPE
ncbi:MAG TPA: hypothetical protein VNI81_11985 [Candidatus Limnocylindrales bacterium]|nr:hypothetical protein [Candidatus Limnocylindrales bacterium]